MSMELRGLLQIPVTPIEARWQRRLRIDSRLRAARRCIDLALVTLDDPWPIVDTPAETDEHIERGQGLLDEARQLLTEGDPNDNGD